MVRRSGWVAPPMWGCPASAGRCRPSAVVGQHVLQPAYRARSSMTFCNRRHVPSDHQRRGADPPRIIKATVADGTRTEEPRPEGVRVVSAQTAQTVRGVLRTVVQRDPMGYQRAPARRPGTGLSDGGQDGHRPADDPAAVATSTTSTRSPSRAWPPSTIPSRDRPDDGRPGAQHRRRTGHSTAPLSTTWGSLIQRENVPRRRSGRR